MNLNDQLSKLDAMKLEIDSLRPIDADQEKRVMQKFRLDWNYNSNAIEGNMLSLGETAALLSFGLTAKGKPLKDHLDITGHNTALDMLAEYVRNNEPLTEYLIRGLHREMLGETSEISSVNENGIRITRTIAAGVYKTIPNHVVTSTGITRMFALPVETAAMMGDLVAWYTRENAEQALHPVVFAATFHHRFVAIHPFDDGNGRLARILMNLILMRRGYLPAIFRLAERTAYISALVQADSGDLAPLCAMVAEECIRSSDIYLKAASGAVVDDLSDFDKQLALLTQTILAERKNDGKQTSSQTHLLVFESMVAPVFESVGARMQQVRPMFSVVEENFIAKSSSGVLDLSRKISEYKAAVAQRLANHTLVEAQYFFHGNSFIRDSLKDFIISLKFNFHLYEFKVSLQTSYGNSEIFSSDYEALFTKVDADELSKAALEVVLKAVQHLTQHPAS